MEKIYNFFATKISNPSDLIWIYIVCLAFTIISTFLLCFFCRNISDKAFRIIIFLFWIFIVILEVFKQIFSSFTLQNGNFIYSYNWGIFPFQLCATPLYTLPFIFLQKDSKFRDTFISYMSTFSFLGGFMVFLFPDTVFHEIISISYQSLIYHGVQLILGVYLATYNRKKLSIKYFLSAIPLFLIYLIIAVILNETLGVKYIDYGFNMWYISPYLPAKIVELQFLYDALPPFVIIIGYGFIVTLASFLIFLTYKLIYKLIKKIRYK